MILIFRNHINLSKIKIPQASAWTVESDSQRARLGKMYLQFLGWEFANTKFWEAQSWLTAHRMMTCQSPVRGGLFCLFVLVWFCTPSLPPVPYLVQAGLTLIPPVSASWALGYRQGCNYLNRLMENLIFLGRNYYGVFYCLHYRFRVLVSWSGSLQMLSDLGRRYIYFYGGKIDAI